MKRIISILAVTALMAVMFVAMASAALAVPPTDKPPTDRPAGGTQGTPAGGALGCFGGTNNAGHAVNGSNPSFDSTINNPSSEEPAEVDDPSDNGLGDAPGYNNGDNVGLDNASDTSGVEGDHCRNDPPEHPLG